METKLTIMHLEAIIKEYKKHLSENSEHIRSLNVDRIEALEAAIKAVNKVAEYENPKEKKSPVMTKEEILLMNRLP